ncbi:MAG: beta strand repeat-containing protein [Bryobacteraceae bacterium]
MLGYWFSPASAAVNNLSSNQTANFTASQVTVQISNTTRPANPNFYVGDSFQVVVQGPPNQQVTNTANQNNNGWSTTPYGYTNSSGRFSMSGVMSSSAAGSWSEVWKVGGIQATPTITFTVTATYTIGGQVTLAGVGLGGVAVSLSGSSTASTTTDANGNYSFTANGSGSYTVTPARATYWFNPASAAVNNLSSNQTVNFVASQATVQVSNTTRPANPNFYVGDSFQIAVQGPPNQQVTNTANQNNNGWSTTPYGYTDSSGRFSMSGVMSPSAAGSWVEVWKVGGIQATPTITFTVSAASYTVGGQVTLGGAGLAGVTVSLSGSSNGSMTTDASGNYSFTAAAGGNYMIAPSKANCWFSPQPPTFTNLSANQTANFTATLVTVQITNLTHPGNPNFNVGDSFQVLVSGPPNQPVTNAATRGGSGPSTSSYGQTNASGTLTISGAMGAGDTGSWTEVWTVGGIPAAPTLSFVVNPLTISGQVTVGAKGLTGVTMSLSGSSNTATTTDANGNYSFTPAAGGNYTVTPSMANNWFNPPSAPINNLSSNQTVNFVASQVTVQVSNTTRPGNTNFNVGDSFQIGVQGPPNQQVTNTVNQNNNGWSTTPYGYTDSSGNFSLSGTMSSSAVGSWTEVWAAAGIQATPTLSFAVSAITPAISSLAPTSGPVATPVTITGTNFGTTQGTSTVTFNGTAASPTSWSATSIVVPVPTGATTGNVVVTVNSTASNGVSFTVAPIITSLSPTSGPTGIVVTITGSNFGTTQGTSTVAFNGTPATPTSWSATSIVVPAPTGASTGNVVVTANGMASNGVAFTVTTGPLITGVSPTSGPTGTVVTITGKNFGATQGTSTVKFNVTAATPTSWSATSIVVKVPTGATTGNVVVTVNSLASNGVGFTVAPSISSVSPTSGSAGTAVTIIGANFGATQGASTVTFNGTSATPTSWNASVIVALVPNGATTGNLVVTANGMASNGVAFAVTAAPLVTGISPIAGPVGSVVTIAGMHFGTSQGTSTLKFNGTLATPTSWGDTSIVAPVPTGAATGSVVVTVNGMASNGATFTVATGPTIVSLSPTYGSIGTVVTITGALFGATQGTVTFNATAATPTSWSANSIVVPVPTGATSGNVVVTAGGKPSNGVPFQITSAMAITVSPTSGPVGTVVTISGSGTAGSNSGSFGANQGASTVTFNGTLATPTSWSASTIVVPVPTGATTGNVVVTVNGAPSAGAPFTVTPAITQLSPPSGPVQVGFIIMGTSFGATQGASTAKINGTPLSVTYWSDTGIFAQVPTGATSGNVVVTVNNRGAGQNSNGVPFTVTQPFGCAAF